MSRTENDVRRDARPGATVKKSLTVHATKLREIARWTPNTWNVPALLAGDGGGDGEEGMTNEEKAKRLEDMALIPVFLDRQDEALLREAAALMRERRSDDAFWGVEYHRDYRRWQLTVGEFMDRWRWKVSYKGSEVCAACGRATTHAAAQAAAMAWVDEREGK